MTPDLGLITTYGDYLWESLWHGTALALATAVLSVTVLRKLSPGGKALLWTFVLLKFLLPPRFLPGLFSFSQWLQWGTAAGAPSGGAGANGAPGPAAAMVVEATGSPAAEYSGWVYVLATLYALGVAAFSAWWAVQAAQVRRRLRRFPSAPGPLATEVEELARTAGLKRRPRTLISPAPGSPYVVGLVRTALVLPDALLTRFQPEARKALILHELAHLRRADLVIRGLQNLVRTLFFFWPPVWWVCSRIERFSEMACDQWAVASSRITERQYAESVLEVVRSLAGGSTRQFNLALLGRGRFLEERFEMILNPKHLSIRKWYAIPLVALWVPFALAGTAKMTAGQDPGEKEKVHKRHVWVHKQHGENDSEPVPADIQEALPEADLNGDGVLTFGELKAHLDAQGEGPQRIVVRKVIRRNAEGEEAPAEITVSVEPHEGKTGWHTVAGETVRVYTSQGELPEEDSHQAFKFRFNSGETEPGQVLINLNPLSVTSGVLERYPQADADGDGELSKEELHEFLSEHPDERPLQFVFAPGPDTEGEAVVWHSVDGDVDYAMASGKDVHVRKVALEEVDTDGDGEISAEELEAYRMACCPGTEGEGQNVFIAVAPRTRTSRSDVPEAEGDRLSRLLEKYPDADLDGDGTLSREEAKALAARLQKAGKPSDQ